VLHVFEREIVYLRTHPRDAIALLVLPLVTIVFALWMFSAGTLRHAPIALLDEDRSALSRRLLTSLDADPALRVRFIVRDQREALSLLRQGRAYAFVVVPHGAERRLLRGERSVVEAYVNSLYLLPASLIEQRLRTVTGVQSATLAVTALGKRGQPQAEGLADTLPIALDFETRNNPRLSYQVYLADAVIPGVMTILILVFSVNALGHELRYGTLDDWLAAAGGSRLQALLGKLLPYTIVLAGYNAVATVWLALLQGWHHGVPAALLGGLLFVTAYQGIAVTIVGLSRNLLQSLTISSAYASPAFAFSGITYPQVGMNGFARIVSYAMPCSYYLELRVQQLQYGLPAIASLHDFAVLLGFSIAGLAIGRLAFAGYPARKPGEAPP
jgi:ABC-2 type transport system permease protein